VRSLVEQMLEQESDIVWTEDVSGLDYVRQRINCYANRRIGGMQFRGLGRRVGYSTLKPGSPRTNNPWWVRREFSVSRDDRSEQPAGVYEIGTPVEGVDPRTVAPGVLGTLTERAWGGPLPVRIYPDRYMGA
jgi:hypothetical protein